MTATTTGNPRAILAARRAAYLITSDEPAEVQAGLRLAFALPRELRTEVLAAVEWEMAEDDAQEDAES
ncbi:hypothetical protein O4J56_20450 [Nocardiopsis sp. RSe5-2]|uniref:Uncharacterized protein n=1 Tax=Nocardiopsis endophytica TaxID=3018445 RepID=A0ABT4U7U8_9ACTN|nr:hypothetical protein [Nocardiopsis endophytica]MDA2813028.1 hypothetical protein [Nocardiopsis endophytica]